MMCPAYKLNKQGENKQPYRTPFSILNQSVVPYSVLTVASDPHTGFSRDRYDPISLRIVHSLCGSYLMKVKEESEKFNLNVSIKNKIKQN